MASNQHPTCIIGRHFGLGAKYFAGWGYRTLSVHLLLLTQPNVFNAYQERSCSTSSKNPTFNSAIKLGARSKFNNPMIFSALSKYLPETELFGTKRPPVYRQSCRNFRTASERPHVIRRRGANRTFNPHRIMRGNQAIFLYVSAPLRPNPRTNSPLISMFYALMTGPTFIRDLLGRRPMAPPSNSRRLRDI